MSKLSNLKNVLTCLVLMMSGSYAYAQQAGNLVPRPEMEDKSSQRLEFEEGLIEGVNKKSGDFASVTAADRDRPKEHIYQRFFSWERERDEVIREMRYSQ